MKKEIIKDYFDQLGNALDRLEESVQAPIDKDRFIIDATIQRFEFTFELFWKNLKNLVELESYEVISPRQVIAQAYQLHWLQDEAVWLEMLKNRNLTSHTYQQVQADTTYNDIKTFYPVMRVAYNDLKKRFDFL